MGIVLGLIVFVLLPPSTKPAIGVPALQVPVQVALVSFRGA